MASWLVRSTPDRVVKARALAGDIVLCSWQYNLLSQCLFHPGVEIDSGKFNAGGNPAMEQHRIQGVGGNTLSRFKLQKPR